jgi:hypothetical protein
LSHFLLDPVRPAQEFSPLPVLQNISDFLDNHAEMVEAVRQDLEQGLKNSRAGPSEAAEMKWESTQLSRDGRDPAPAPARR